MSIKQRTKSLASKSSLLANTDYQLNVLSGNEVQGANLVRFEDKIKSIGVEHIKPGKPEIFQINIGKLCNQTCAHCHVDAGPDRKKENMSRETLEDCLNIIKNHDFTTVDITGGAPEMNPNFRWFVAECSKLGKKIINRCNLTILVAHEKYSDLASFFAEHQVELVSSLPYFSKSRTDSQRGDGVFEDSIKALKQLNKVGYGKSDTGLILNLVYNPTGAFLPGNQLELESEFKRQLFRKYEIVFNNLYAITNLPISRFLDYLIESGNYISYMEELIQAFNPQTLEGLMCKNTISISWEGYIYDCDFNQMLDLKSDISSHHIRDFDMQAFLNRNIIINQHCYGCTAGAGSSCAGEIS